MKVIITGVAGFIGSNLADRLLAEGNEVIGVDNFTTGLPQFLEGARKSPRFRFYERDLLSGSTLSDIFTNDIEQVFHLAANADVRYGLNHPHKDLEQNMIVTWNVLEAMRAAGIKRIAFSSTGSVYGEAKVIPTPEDCPFPIQTSLYAASKIAAEAYISSYAEGYGMHACIFRFVSILGERYTHGHVFDFIRKLKTDPSCLAILGNGKQRKSYLYVHDCIDAILAALQKNTDNRVEIYNLGSDEYCSVDDSVDIICEEMGLKPNREYAGGERGWIGDNPFIFLDCAKIKSIGWKAKRSIRESVRLTTRYLLSNPWIFEHHE